eukprot:COSAG01_NODE_624_length_14732_cov_58.900772_1_plen_99_part_00
MLHGAVWLGTLLLHCCADTAAAAGTGGEIEWTLLLRQTAGFYLPALKWGVHNSGNIDAPNYSILDTLGDSSREDGKFTFKLEWWLGTGASAAGPRHNM